MNNADCSCKRPTQYRSRPVVIEAMRWTGDIESTTAIRDWARSKGVEIRFFEVGADKRTAYSRCEVPTIEGTMTGKPGCWIIRGLKGEFYPCDDDVFAQKYESI